MWSTVLGTWKVKGFFSSHTSHLSDSLQVPMGCPTMQFGFVSDATGVRLRLKHKIALTADASCKYLVLSSIQRGYKVRGLPSSPPLYLLFLVFLNKGYYSGIAQWKRCLGQSLGRGIRSVHVLSGCATLPPSWFVPSQEAHWTSLFVGFYGCSLCRHKAWPWVISLISIPSLLCTEVFGGGGWQLQTSSEGLFFFFLFVVFCYQPPS